MRTCVLPPRGLEIHSESPWNSLLDGLRRAGHYLVASAGDPCEALVSLNHQPLVKHLQSQHCIAPSKTALVALEPRVTFPLMYTNRVLRRYGHRYAPSPLWAESLQAITFSWPQEIHPQQQIEGPYEFAATMINGDKRSAVAGSLYGLRRRVIQQARERNIALAVYGPGWGAAIQDRLTSGVKASLRAMVGDKLPRMGEALSLPAQRPQYWLGTVEDKQTAFASAPVAIVIENSADYMSEKLIDAIRCGTAPVYVGPSLDCFGLPNSLAAVAPPDASGVLDVVERLSETQIEDLRSAGREWLNSNEAKQHDIRGVLASLGQLIGEQLTGA